MAQTDMLVVGAGIAGLTAAWTLQQGGRDVQVLEASDAPGGRLRSVLLDGRPVDIGAQYWSSAYRYIPPLLQELGLQQALLPVSPWSALWCEGRIHRVHLARPLHWMRPLGFWGGLQMLWGQARSLWPYRQHNSSDVTAWQAADVGDAAHWSARSMGVRNSARLAEALLDGFYFQGLSGSSPVLPLAMASFGLHRPQTLAMQGGLGRLSEALAARLRVHYQQPALKVEISDSGYCVHTPQQQWRTRQLILAIPAPMAQHLHPAPDQQEQTVLQTPYVSGANLVLQCVPDWRLPAALQEVYGLLVPPAAQWPFAAVGIERSKTEWPADAGERLHVMLSGQRRVGTAWLEDESQLLATVMPALDRVLPGVQHAVQSHKLFAWPEAMPRIRPGHARAVAAWRDSRPARNTLWLAGDWLGLPWSDSAAGTGRWVAQQILQQSG